MKRQLKVWTALIVIIISSLALSSGKVDAMSIQEKATWLWDTSLIMDDQEKYYYF